MDPTFFTSLENLYEWKVHICQTGFSNIHSSLVQEALIAGGKKTYFFSVVDHLEEPLPHFTEFRQERTSIEAQQTFKNNRF